MSSIWAKGCMLMIVCVCVLLELTWLLLLGGGEKVMVYTLSGCAGSALVWHTHGRAFKSRMVQQVL